MLDACLWLRLEGNSDSEMKSFCFECLWRRVSSTHYSNLRINNRDFAQRHERERKKERKGDRMENGNVDVAICMKMCRQVERD